MTESPQVRGIRPVIDDIQISRADEIGLLRSFSATIGDGERDAPIGHIRGLIAWRSELLHLFEAADELSGEAATLARAADQIRDADYRPGADDQIDTVLMVEMIALKRKSRGRRVAGEIIDQVIDLLALDPLTTLVVLEPEPQQDGGGPMPKGAARTAALNRLRAAYEAQGFERWKRSTVWWGFRPLAGFDDES